MIPSPQTSGSGVNYTASIPARYTETQFTLNIDHQFSSKQKLGMRVFGANVPQIVPLSGRHRGTGLPAVPGLQKPERLDEPYVDDQSGYG